jgi:hypothetical protein
MYSVIRIRPAGAALIDKENVVVAVKLPGSVAVTVTETGDPTVVLGVPEIVAGLVKLKPDGKPETLSVNEPGVSASAKVLAGIT